MENKQTEEQQPVKTVPAGGAPQKKKLTFLSVLLIQGAVIIYTGSDICSKIASQYAKPHIGMMWVLFMFLDLVCLGLYAIFWQQIIKHFDLSVAYANRATAIFWSMLWAAVIFRERITAKNIIAVIVIFIGVMLVNQDAD